MIGENSTLEDLTKELKAAQENVEDSAAFPSEFSYEKNKEILENNPDKYKTTEGKIAETEENSKKRKLVNDTDFEDEEDQKKKKLAEFKCRECQFKCYTTAELSTHHTTTHGQKKRLKVCENCSFTSDNVWEMDFHCKSRGHKLKKDDSIPCKKCDYLAVNKDDSWVHKKVHIPPEKLFECAECVWVGDRLDNIRYHCHSQGHDMKIDYEAIALARAEAKGPKEVAQYNKKLTKDIKMATKGSKK